MIQCGKRFGLLVLCSVGFFGVIAVANLRAQDAPEKASPPEQIGRFLKWNAESKATVESFLQDEIARQDERLKAVTTELADKRKWKISENELKRTFFSLEEKREALAQLEAEIQELKAGRKESTEQLQDWQQSAFGPISEFSELEVGQFGTLDGWVCEIVQIVDGENLMVRTGHARLPPAPVNLGIQVGSYEDALLQQKVRGGIPTLGRAEISGPGQTVWIRGLATKGLVDGKRIEPEEVFEVTGTKKIGGTRTIFVLERVDLEEVERFAPKPPVVEAKPEKSKASPVSKPRSGTKSKAKLAN
ncbi:hypothetical protein [Planctellipticum variicoloris]|uniref:hypothetical protein n=1 Tax=Planctellipticum variicoloris TaxID=3064265 RepID=UPI003013D515|nr:protein regulator of cytokinesis family protein [Planctomycetaceae bacterium SH412]